MGHFKKASKKERDEFRRRITAMLEPFQKIPGDGILNEFKWRCETDYGIFVVTPDFHKSEFDMGLFSVMTRFIENDLYKGFPHDQFGNTAYHGKWCVIQSSVDLAVKQLEYQLSVTNARPPNKEALARWAEYDAKEKIKSDEYRKHLEEFIKNEKHQPSHA